MMTVNTPHASLSPETVHFILLAIELSVLQFTGSDYPFRIFRLFFFPSPCVLTKLMTTEIRFTLEACWT